MFSGKKANYTKLRTNLRLCINRLKLLEKKKAELALKSRREIADYLSNGKDDRARIRVEHIIREDYMVEAMEMVEMFCDLLLARFGLIEKMKEMDPGLEEAIATILWTSPRLQSDIQELREVSHQFTNKYGKEFTEQCVKNGLDNVNDKVMVKMSLHAPSSMLIENYLIEIAKAYNVPYTPDMTALEGTQDNLANDLIEIGVESGPDKKDPRGPGGGGAFGGGGGGGFQYPDAGGGGPPKHQALFTEPPPFQPGSSAFYPGETAPSYEESQFGASGLVPGRPLVGPDSHSPVGKGGGSSLAGPNSHSPVGKDGGSPLVRPDSHTSAGRGGRCLTDRPPPPLPSQPPNSGGSSPAGRGAGCSPGGIGYGEEESGVYDYATTPSPLSRGVPGTHSRPQQDNGNSSGFGFDPSVANPYYGRNEVSSGVPGLSPDHASIPHSDDVYVPVLPDVPDLASNSNIQSGKHNTDYARGESPVSGAGVHPEIDKNLYVPVLPDLPAIPSDSSNTHTAGHKDGSHADPAGNDDIDFDDLSKRFEALKKK